MPNTPFDNDLLDRILENLKSEPSEQLRKMLANPGVDIWSPEALHAARRLLEQRSQGIAAEPKYRTVPTVVPEEPFRSPGELWTGDKVLAPGFSVPRGFSWLLFLGRLLGRGTLFPGIIQGMREHAAYVIYYNGNRGWVRLADVHPLALDVGSRLYCSWRGETGTISHCQDEDEKFYIRYDDGHAEWVTLKQYAVPRSLLA